MIRINSKRNKFTYNIYHIAKAFYPGEEVEQTVDGEQEALVTLEMPGGSSFPYFRKTSGSLMSRIRTSSGSRKKNGRSPAAFTGIWKNLQERSSPGGSSRECARPS